MKIILLQNIKSLGRAGEIKEVAEGYARNFLLPKKLVEIATEETIKKIKAEEIKKKEKEKDQENKNLQLAEKIKKAKITILAKEKNGKLFGAISVKDVVAALKREDLAISEKAIIIRKAIKTEGEHEVEIELSKNISTKLKLVVKGN